MHMPLKEPIYMWQFIPILNKKILVSLRLPENSKQVSSLLAVFNRLLNTHFL